MTQRTTRVNFLREYYTILNLNYIILHYFSSLLEHDFQKTCEVRENTNGMVQRKLCDFLSKNHL